MSDADDQDKTRIQPRMRKPAPVKSAPQTDADFISAPTMAGVNKAGARDADGVAKTQALRTPITESRGQGTVSSADLLKGRFVLEKVLGAGGMGVVYKAKDLLKVEAQDRDPYVAIKVLGEEFKSHPEAFIALQRESRKTQRIAHPNIVNVHDFDKDGDTVFMTMEYLEGTPLDKVVKKFRGTGLPHDKAWQILKGICAALAYAHDQRLIHSDLKPGNIFVTSSGLAKVFDFGIARAVAKAEQGDGAEVEDKTVFDAGNLGALTPAYASLEMLEGDPPDVRDDIYALGCIAYELFSGNHPFKRKNAKEAFRKGYKADRLKGLTKKQWKVIESALALEREDRIGSVHEFWQKLSTKNTGRVKLWAAVLLVTASLGIGISSQFTKPAPQPVGPQISEEDIRTEMESKIRLETVQRNLTKLFTTLRFDARWEADVWQEVQTLSSLLGADDPQTQSAYAKAYEVYIAKIIQAMDEKSFDNAKKWMASAHKYTSDGTQLSALESNLNATLAEIQRLEAERKEQERKRREVAAAKESARQQAAVKVNSSKKFNTVLESVNEQLACNRLLDMSALNSDITQLKKLDSSRYKTSEPQIVQGLSDCIARITRNFPVQGLKAQKAAQAMFGDSEMFKAAANSSAKKDSCKAALAGLGARGRRSRCQDSLTSGTKSPLTVVIPGSGNINTFAMGRYEVSVAEYNQYCLASGACKALGQSNTSLPVTNISYSDVQAYLAWLSEESGSTYRLPSMDEWTLAAKAKGRSLDSNRNCKLDIRGIQKGGSLVQASIGQQNSWGLVNFVGNAAEWVTHGEDVFVVGGSYNTDMQNCTLDEKTKSNGRADEETGFRVLRELK